MFKINSRVNYLGADWQVKTVGNGEVTLKSPSKHLNDVVVESRYWKHIRAGWFK